MNSRVKCSIQRFDSGAYTRMQFLRTIMSHSLGAHTDAFQFAPDASDDDDDIDAAPAEPAHASSSALRRPRQRLPTLSHADLDGAACF